MNRDTLLTIAQIAEQAGVTYRTLHYYEEQGLLSPIRHGEGEHRMYDFEQVTQLQKIVALKFLGFSIKEIRNILKANLSDQQWADMLVELEKQVVAQKEGLELALQAIHRIQSLSDLAGSEQLTTLLTFVHGIQSSHRQQAWLEEVRGKEAVAAIFKKHEPETVQAMDTLYLDFVERIKQKCGEPVDTPEVQQLISQYMNAQMELVGPEAIEALGDVNELDITQLEEMTAGTSPFMLEEEQWLQEAIEYVMNKQMGTETSSNVSTHPQGFRN
ncbi:DNA-binding transcriptional MerR regulator [Paenibacillus turicensis]|uniref:DNA-binding transcriptional MerR regulator n=1 Tax=Paenibacillus turicensis TaxID=160487 RepID=A0ABS4FTB0_9BACL|nr:MerR family transcriptional regulator [Paenibacillus turicensis]MBP1905785.1 DNA-binding transcriptional MerR regulator [Paenibacillus turicensis]